MNSVHSIHARVDLDVRIFIHDVKGLYVSLLSEHSNSVDEVTLSGEHDNALDNLAALLKRDLLTQHGLRVIRNVPLVNHLYEYD